MGKSGTNIETILITMLKFKSMNSKTSLFVVLICALLAISFMDKGQNSISCQSPDCLDSLEIPSAFTPNNDGINEAFKIDFPCVPEKFFIEIRNNWGVLMFQSRESDFEWYGLNTSEEDVAIGVYNFKMTYVFNSKEVNLEGDITLLR